jgi:Uma2 family endonuclease
MTLMTTEEFMALPDDGVERMLIRGVLRQGTDVSRRGRYHTRTEAKLSRYLDSWLSSQAEPPGEVLAGDQAFRFDNDPDTVFGIDVAYVSADLATAFPPDVFLIGGTPTLAVEILSPSDTYKDVVDKLRTFLNAGVPLVWLVDPAFQTVIQYRPGTEPAMYAKGQQLDGGGHLPGFQLAIADLFGR